MDRDLFIHCLDEVQKTGVGNVYFHVLGEPTLHPHFEEFLGELGSRDLKLNLTTNGTTIQKNSGPILSCTHVRQVNFSTHAFAELPREEAEQQLKNVLDFCEKAKELRPDLYINLRLWNVGDSSSDSWNAYMLSQVNARFGTNVNPGHFCSRHKSFGVVGRIYLHEDSRFVWPSETAEGGASHGAVAGTCRALDTHVAILHNGPVVACCLDHSGQITLGNIQAQSLQEILTGPLATDLREGFALHQLRHPFCKNCTFCKRFK